MESPGKYLKVERELRNLSLEEVAQFTRIKKHILKAIEEDEYELLPPGIYVKGFLTAYAKYLGLDPKDVILRYQNYLKSLTLSKPLELPQQTPPPKKRVRPWVPIIPTFSIILFIIFAIILFIVVIIYYDTPNEPMEGFISSFEEEKSPPVPLPSIPLPLPIQEKVGTQTIHPDEQKENSRLKEMVAKDAILSEAPPVEVLDAGIGTGVEREGGRLILIGKRSEFICNNQRAYFFTRIKAQREGKIIHVWLWKGKEFQRIEIEIKPPAWSVYSYLTLRPNYAGNWEAEVRDGGKVLSSLSFKATESDHYSSHEKR